MTRVVETVVAVTLVLAVVTETVQVTAMVVLAAATQPHVNTCKNCMSKRRVVFIVTQDC